MTAIFFYNLIDRNDLSKFVSLLLWLERGRISPLLFKSAGLDLLVPRANFTFKWCRAANNQKPRVILFRSAFGDDPFRNAPSAGLLSA